MNLLELPLSMLVTGFESLKEVALCRARFIDCGIASISFSYTIVESISLIGILSSKRSGPLSVLLLLDVCFTASLGMAVCVATNWLSFLFFVG